MGRSRVWTMASSPVPVAVTTSGPGLEAGGYWVSSNRAVTVTVSLSSPASIGVGAGAPAANAREKATGIWRPASSVSTISLPILGAPRARVDLGLPPRVGDGKRARLVEQRAWIIVAEADAVGADDLQSLPHL